MIHLHTHRDYSTIDGCGTCQQFSDRASELGEWALGISDHGTLSGVLAHLKACETSGIHPIIGCEFYYKPNRHTQGLKEWRYKRWHMILIAQNLVGWHNLVRLSSESYRSGFHQNPCIDDELLDRYHEGLICTTACVIGPLAYLIENATESQVGAWVDSMASRFDDRFYFALHPHDFDRQRAINLEIVSWGQRKGIPFVAESDAHYVWEYFASTQKIRAMIATNTSVAKAAEENRKRVERGEEVYELGHEGLFMMSENQMFAAFSRNHPQIPQSIVSDAISNTDVIAARVQPFLLDRQLKMPNPKFTPEASERQVREWCREGLRRIGKYGDSVYERQVEYELGVMRDVGVFPYIVLVADGVRWARSSEPLPVSANDPQPGPKRPMRVGSSRGSAGGSLVCCLSQITSLDPIGHKLKFERFLNPGRKGLPDIDVDFPDDRRDEVKEFYARKYGRDCIADVAAFSRFTARAAISDVARILGVDRKATKDVTDLIDSVHDEDLSKLRDAIPQLDAYARLYPHVWEHAERLENQGDPMISRVGKHAAGLIMTPGPINNWIPTIRSGENDPTQRTAWSETPRLSIVDDFGLVKLDLLSITGMTQQDQILARIAERTGEEIDLDALPVCSDPYAVEPEVMEKFRFGVTLGVNQFEGEGITGYMRSARPENVVDLAAINAIYRPGPMGSKGHEAYANRRIGVTQSDIPSGLEHILGETYGSLCFQEQIMELFEELVGYSAAQADDVRKDIDKLNRGKSDQGRIRLSQRKSEFILKASVKVGKDIAERLWKEILPYTGYSFNRAHASGYTVQAYQDMWLKVHYPLDFYAVLLTLESEKTPRAIREAEAFGVTVVAPDINRSGVGFSVDYGERALRYGFAAIDGIGDVAAKAVVEKQPYDSLEHFNFVHSVKYSKVNKSHREALDEAGALDSLGARSNLSEAQKALLETKRLKVSLREGGTFGDDEANIRSYAHTREEFDALPIDSHAVIAGRIENVTNMKTKRGRNPGQEMARIVVRFGIDTWQVTAFPAVYAGYKELFEKGRGIIISGEKDDRGQVIMFSAKDAEEYLAEQREKEMVSCQ